MPQSITRIVRKWKKMIQNNEQPNNQITKLEAAIARSRQRLQSLWDAKGYTDAEVLRASVELDLLIDEYERLIQGEKPLRVSR